MSTYSLCVSLIKKGSSVVTAEKLDIFMLAGRISNEEYIELMEMLNPAEEETE